MNKLANVLFCFFFLILTSACQNITSIDYDRVFYEMDFLKKSQYLMISDFEHSKELAILEKDPDQLYGFVIAENYNSFLDQSSLIINMFQEVLVYNSDNLFVKEHFDDVYYDKLINYSEFVKLFYTDLTTKTLDENTFNLMIVDLNIKSEEFFYEHIEMLDLLFSYKWNTRILNLREK